MAKIIIKRNKSFCGSANKFDVYLANTYIGELKIGGKLEINVDMGSHILFFKSRLKIGKSSDTSFEVVVNEPDEMVEIKSGFDMRGKFVVEYADNAPHIPAYANSMNIESEKQFETSSSNSTNRKIIIKRKNSFGGGAYKFDVYLMNNYVGELKSGDILEIPVDVGSHMLFFKSNLKLNLGKSPDTSFEVVVNTTDDVVEIISQFDMNGNFVVSYADNAPHIPTYANSMNVESEKQFETRISNPINRLRCPKCGGYNLTPISETITQGKDFSSSNACCGYLLCGPLGLLFGLSGKGKQVITNTYWICSDCGNKFKAQ